MVLASMLLFLPPAAAAEDRAGTPPAVEEQRTAEDEGGAADRPVSFNREFLVGVIGDTGQVLKSPSRWDAREWKKFSLFYYTGLTLVFFDEDIQEWSQRGKKDKWHPDYEEDLGDELMPWVKPLGDIENSVLPLGALYLYGHLAENRRAKRVVLYCAESLLISNLLAQVVKVGLNRERPCGKGVVDYEWGPDCLANPRRSMPSGHAVTAFALATVFATEYRDIRLVPPLAYTLAGLSAYSRIHENRHWASDVFVGACLGYFTAKTVIKLQQERRVAIFLVVDSDTAAIHLSARF